MFISRNVRRWPVAPGRIVEKSVGASTTTGASRPGRYFEPRVTYTYIVGGKSYTGRRISPVTDAYGEEQAKRVVARFPDKIDVRYDPQDPANAYLRPVSYGSITVMLLAGIACLFAAVFSLFTR